MSLQLVIFGAGDFWADGVCAGPGEAVVDPRGTQPGGERDGARRGGADGAEAKTQNGSCGEPGAERDEREPVQLRVDGRFRRGRSPASRWFGCGIPERFGCDHRLRGRRTFVQASISVQAPLLFWSLLPGGESRTTTVASSAVAGISAPLCTGCGIVPVAVQAPDQTEPIDWGFVPGGLYTFYYSCTGTTPGSIAGTPIPYVILNRVDADLDESNQMFRQGAQGLTGSTIQTPNTCATSSPSAPASCVEHRRHRIDSGQRQRDTGPVRGRLAASGRDESAVRTADTPEHRCASALPDQRHGFRRRSRPITSPTPFPGYIDDPTAYTGNGRRILTVAVVNALASDMTCAAAMTVLGFRQFLLEPASDGSFDPTDGNGRFAALYLGSSRAGGAGMVRYAVCALVPSYLTVGPGQGGAAPMRRRGNMVLEMVAVIPLFCC